MYRYRRASNVVERQQTKWVVFAVTIFFVIVALTSFIGAFVPGFNLMIENSPRRKVSLYMLAMWLTSPLMAVLPAAIAFPLCVTVYGILISFINRALVYGALTIVVVGIYVVIVGGLSIIFQGNGIGGIFTLTTDLLPSSFNQCAIIFNIASTVSCTASAMILRRALSFWSKLIDSAPDLIPASHCGDDCPHPQTVSTVPSPSVADLAKVPCSVHPLQAVIRLLIYHGQLVGELHVAPRAPDEPFTPNELRLLEDIARQAESPFTTCASPFDLQIARERLVTTREEERRRLRRDSHDGLASQTRRSSSF